MSSNVRDEALSLGSPLVNKVAVVTGASRGIGRAIALRLGRMGASVAICARKRADIEHTAASFREEGIRALPIVADVTAGGRHREVNRADLGRVRRDRSVRQQCRNWFVWLIL